MPPMTSPLPKNNAAAVAAARGPRRSTQGPPNAALNPSSTSAVVKVVYGGLNHQGDVGKQRLDRTIKRAPRVHRTDANMDRDGCNWNQPTIEYGASIRAFELGRLRSSHRSISCAFVFGNPRLRTENIGDARADLSATHNTKAAGEQTRIALDNRVSMSSNVHPGLTRAQTATQSRFWHQPRMKCKVAAGDGRDACFRFPPHAAARPYTMTRLR